MKKAFTTEYTMAIKGIAIIMLVVYHCFSSVDRLGGYDVQFIFAQKGMQWANQSNICVGIFTFLSAYGICKSLKGENPFEKPGSGHHYYVHRITNLLTGYWIIAIPFIIITYFIVGSLPYKQSMYGIEELLLDVFALSGVTGSTTLCGTWWYMSFAILIVLLVPLYKKIDQTRGLSGTLLTIFLLWTLSIPMIRMTKWILLVPMGVWAASHDIIEKVDDISITQHKVLDDGIKIVIFGILIYILSFLAMSFDITQPLKYVYHPLAAFIFIIFAYLILQRTALLRKILCFFGKYSMDIFLIHTFIRHNWFPDFTYSLGSTVLIFLYVFGLALAIAIVLEAFKKLIHYSIFEKWLENKINQLIETFI